MWVHRSNRAEELVEALAQVVADRAGSSAPFMGECIAVQSGGMQRWLSRQLARRLGIWASPDFPKPRQLVERIVDPTPEHTPRWFHPEVMPWAVAARLPGLLGRREFAPVRRYLGDDPASPRLLPLATRIASTFEQYLVFRPEMIVDWEGGGPGDWQSLLWQALVGAHSAPHIVTRARQFLAAVAAETIDPATLPARISVFGVSTLAPLYMQVLRGVSRHRPVHLFLLSPAPDYWAHLRSAREQARIRARAGAAGHDSEDLHLEEGNPLLASLGKVGREFQEIIEEGEYQDDERYLDPGRATVLHALQSDIFHLRGPGAAADGAPTPDDGSVRVHACHSPMREVEVLYDQLLDLFATRPDLAPHDVFVLSPAIDTYAPLVDAVFGGDGTGKPPLPYRIADRAVRSTDGAVDAFLTLLAGGSGRMSATEVLDLLSFEAIAARFDIVDEDLDQVRTWVSQAGIRWGVDAAHRASLDQPNDGQNTWRFGLDRLLLGYAMTGDEQRLFGGVLPYDDIEGNETTLLGRLAEFCDTLFSLQQQFEGSRSIDDWHGVLHRALAATTADTDATATQLQQIRHVLAAMRDHAATAGFEGAVDFDTIRHEIEARLEDRAPGRGFLTDGITFGTMLPMRSIPAKVLCLLGMNDTDFPRQRRPLGFDLMAAHPRIGDRSVRDDDRYLFLEALLSARERLIITYVGRSIRDDAELPPSVVVSELLEAIAAARNIGEAPAPGSPGDVLVVHPLQAFSPRYFGAGSDSRLFSYSPLYCAGGRALLGERRAVGRLLPEPLAPAIVSDRRVSLQQLTSFFGNPAGTFLQQRLGLRLAKDDAALESREPIELSNLDKWQVGEPLRRRTLDGAPLAELLPAARAGGRLPLGNLGRHRLRAIHADAEVPARLAAWYRGGDSLPSRTIDLRLGDTEVSGRIDDLWPGGRVCGSFSTRKSKQLLELWIMHLVAACSGLPPMTSRLISRATGGALVTELAPVEAAESRVHLSALLKCYWDGQETPLPLFGEASFAYAAKLAKDGTESEALAAAASALVTELERDEYLRTLLAGDADPLGRLGSGTGTNSFAAVAHLVYDPILDHMASVTCGIDQLGPEGPPATVKQVSR